MTPSPPRSWFDTWPAGAPHADSPAAAQWVAELAQLLQAFLDVHAETPSSFARKTGLDAATVEAVVTGTRWPTLHTAIAIVAGVQELPSRSPKDPNTPRPDRPRERDA